MRATTLIPVEPLQERVIQLHEEGGESWSNIARKIGWVKEIADISRLRRTLGIAYHPSHGNKTHRSESITEETALHICEALGIDPVDIGL